MNNYKSASRWQWRSTSSHVDSWWRISEGLSFTVWSASSCQ